MIITSINDYMLEYTYVCIHASQAYMSLLRYCQKTTRNNKKQQKTTQ